MSWFCKRCGDLFLDFGENYCEDCKKFIKQQQEEIKRIKRERREEKKEKRKKEINEYKKINLSQIEKKYGVIIDFTSEIDLKNNKGFFESILGGTTRYENKIIILYQDKTIQNKIDDLKKESKEIEEAMKELEDIKNETLR